jgi:hypothetical protein
MDSNRDVVVVPDAPPGLVGRIAGAAARLVRHYEMFFKVALACMAAVWVSANVAGVLNVSLVSKVSSVFERLSSAR